MNTNFTTRPTWAPTAILPLADIKPLTVSVFLTGCYDGALPSNRDGVDQEEERRLLFVGMTRVYLGVHFPTDVLAGWCIGAVAIVITAEIILAVERRRGALLTEPPA